MRKVFLPSLLSVIFFAFAYNAFGLYSPTLELRPEITLNGENFILENVPHDQAEELNTVNIPIKLGNFTSPVNLHMHLAGVDYHEVVWTVKGCFTHNRTNYYIEYVDQGNYETHLRLADDPGPATEDDRAFYESEDRYDFNADVTLSMPGCYAIRVSGENQEGESNFEDDIYFIVEPPADGYLTPEFSVQFDHSDLSIYDEALNESLVVLAPEYVTLRDTSIVHGEVNIASREWSIEWYSDPFAAVQLGNAILPISTADKGSASLSYNFNNIGTYIVKLKVTDSNGISYEKEKWLFSKGAKGYFRAVILQRDSEERDFTSFLATVAGIQDPELVSLYDAALDGCESQYIAFDENSGGTRVSCSDEVEALFDEYDAGLISLDVKCTHFPDLSDYNSYDELCRAAAVVKRVDAFQGDAEDSPTAGYLRPNSSINRIEICAVLNKSKISSGSAAVPAGVTNSRYPDLDDLANNDWRKINAEACTQFNGYEDGSFRPASNINLVEVLKVLLRLYDYAPNEGSRDLDEFCPDLSNIEWYSSDMSLAFEKGFLEGLEDNCNPGKVVTRGDVVIIMYRMFREYAYIAAP